ncbi:hypothetical protein A3A09_02375 [Candidatus Nomurabacteria bacterium RIFCSPLOWO2_01_FULL_42_20]|uniref:GIY-YIG domain-containing protein n=1 Tax=Candidatus Nomurabacteria bacterium RIFCSPHIGHO2_01_FULL_42_16 TaxID=1801743 RepID=A0A1F6VJZ6_9BACT|nr:MAG: hypothetical protein A2824_01390 [Candidatus Nomurabacteria bacterium RIFCSPHIGHO2_01_FULL_42_16]OGI92125.1 MAG: hypothetical protein A3A09_02375 [Candidatus Nomurabacteria bacterium RIFCSPLOWO2_01_FULL_42_20]
MNYVYILYSQKDNGLCIGKTKDLKKRFDDHKNGRSLATKHRRPFVLIHYEAFVSTKDATAREIYLKSGHGRAQLKEMLKSTFEKYKI